MLHDVGAGGRDDDARAGAVGDAAPAQGQGPGAVGEHGGPGGAADLAAVQRGLAAAHFQDRGLRVGAQDHQPGELDRVGVDDQGAALGAAVDRDRAGALLGGQRDDAVQDDPLGVGPGRHRDERPVARLPHRGRDGRVGVGAVGRDQQLLACQDALPSSSEGAAEAPAAAVRRPGRVRVWIRARRTPTRRRGRPAAMRPKGLREPVGAGRRRVRPGARRPATPPRPRPARRGRPRPAAPGPGRPGRRGRPPRPTARAAGPGSGRRSRRSGP